jgi:hypothetical protein
MVIGGAQPIRNVPAFLIMQLLSAIIAPRDRTFGLAPAMVAVFYALLVTLVEPF